MDKIIEEIFNSLKEKSWLCEDSEFTAQKAEDFAYEVLPNINWNNGASKIVFIPSESDYVIKIPFSGQEETVYGEDDEVLDYTDFHYFFGANEHWDYCAVEVEISSKAEKLGLGKCFAKTIFLGDMNGYPVYSQEKATTFFDLKDNDDIDMWSKEKVEKNKKTRTKCKEMQVCCFNSTWLSDFIEYYGEKTFKDFMLFLKEERIGDLHSENIGYIEDRPVLIDYSDFRE